MTARFANCGGNYNNGSNAGPAYRNWNNRRSNTNAVRPVFVGCQVPYIQESMASAADKKSFAPSLSRENRIMLGRPVGEISSAAVPGEKIYENI